MKSMHHILSRFHDVDIGRVVQVKVLKSQNSAISIVLYDQWLVKIYLPNARLYWL